MERISRRKWWLFLVVLSSGIAVLLCKKWFFASAACPRLQDLLLYGSAIVIGFIGLIYVMVTRSDSFVTQIVSILVVLGAILLVSTVAGSILSGQTNIQMVFCPNTCEQSISAANLRAQGKLDGAEDVARTCIANTSTGILPQECSGSCDLELSKVLFDKAGVLIDSSLTGAWNPDWKTPCDQAAAQLTEAHSIAVAQGDQTLVDAITERQSRLADKCTIQPTPVYVRIDVLRKQIGDQDALLDVRVMRNNVYQADLQSPDFTLKVNGSPITFTLTQHQADAAICLVAVMDNSGSIGPGLQSMRDAISKINDFRKPDDKFGLITFGAKNEVLVKQSLALEPLDPKMVDGSANLTALWDGINLGLDTIASCQTETRYLLVMTEGIDNDSRYMTGSAPLEVAQSLASKAAGQNTDICVVGVTKSVDTNSLGAVAHGCGFLYAADFDAVASQFQNIFGYMTDFYRITFPVGELSNQQVVTLKVPDSGEATIDFSTP